MKATNETATVLGFSKLLEIAATNLHSSIVRSVNHTGEVNQDKIEQEIQLIEYFIKGIKDLQTVNND